MNLQEHQRAAREEFDKKCPPPTWSKNVSGGESIDIPLEAVEFIHDRERIQTFIDSLLSSFLEAVEGEVKDSDFPMSEEEGNVEWRVGWNTREDALREAFTRIKGKSV